MAASQTTLIQWLQSDADYRLQIAAIRAALAASGWVQVTQSNDINPATAVRPAANTKGGSEIWRMDDALQATYPIFLRIFYGVSSTSLLRLWLMIGQANNGAGSLTTPAGGQVASNELSLSMAQTQRSSTDTTLYKALFSGDTGRFTSSFYVDIPGTAPWPIGFFVERTRDSTGAVTNEGAALACFFAASDANFTSGYWQVQYYPLQGQALPPVEKNWAFNMPRQILSSIIGNKAYTYPFQPTYPGWKFPFKSFQAYISPDLSPLIATTVSLYGTNHAYMPIVQAGYADASTQRLCLAQLYQ
jgi:hypothetical protein